MKKYIIKTKNMWEENVIRDNKQKKRKQEENKCRKLKSRKMKIKLKQKINNIIRIIQRNQNK